VLWRMQSFVSATYSEISNLLKYNEESHFSRLMTTLSNGMLGNNDVTSSAVRKMPWDLPRIISLSPLSLATDVTDATLGTTGLWLGTWIGAGCTATITKSFFDRSPWPHGQHFINPIPKLHFLKTIYFPIFKVD